MAEITEQDLRTLENETMKTLFILLLNSDKLSFKGASYKNDNDASLTLKFSETLSIKLRVTAEIVEDDSNG